MMTSAAETPSPLWMSVGMPRPLSRTVHEPSGLSVTSDLGGVAGERLVDGVVDDLVDHVMQAGAVIGVADIHARALAHRVEALEDLDRFCAVVVGRDVGGRVRPCDVPRIDLQKCVRISVDLTRKCRCRTAQSGPANMLIQVRFLKVRRVQNEAIFSAAEALETMLQSAAESRCRRACETRAGSVSKAATSIALLRSPTPLRRQQVLRKAIGGLILRDRLRQADPGRRPRIPRGRYRCAGSRCACAQFLPRRLGC